MNKTLESAEIIAVGTELLLGQIANTNAQYLSTELAGLGLNVFRHTAVGDNPARIREALEAAAERADLLIVTGGLGPTQDDVTREVTAEFLGETVEMDAAGLEKIEAFFRERGLTMAESNRRQALTIRRSDTLPNDTGMAVGSAYAGERCALILLPGPPRELRPMFARYAVPWLRQRLPDMQPLYSRMLRFAGIGESSLEKQLLDLIEGQQDPTLAPYAKEGEVTVRVTTRAANEQEAEEKLAPLLREIRKRVGDHLYAETDIPLEQAVAELLLARGERLAAAESCTGGKLSDLLTGVPGSSSVFAGSVVCYTNAVKQRLLQVPADWLEPAPGPEQADTAEPPYGAVSARTAERLAEQAAALMEADWALALTGAAGPDPAEGHPPGTVYIALARRGERASAQKLLLTGDRDMIKLKACKHALFFLWKRLVKGVNSL
ncbi:CinA-like protein [Xylanibacillus composti]|uniref:Putative competence-damage inducible protein n=1 Tax=Xylanibacillus composti TaxID=1572762 RepID=A0A8J4H4V3_9BACL|nr:competence/damage-inducible protein A [Xylanibacillus composti]GIQ68568.1 CinA-like protein [Xylanibacillus composti]